MARWKREIAAIGLDDGVAGARARGTRAEGELSMRETEGNGASRDSFSFRYFTRFDVAVTDVWMNGGGEAPRLSSFRRREGMRRRRRR